MFLGARPAQDVFAPLFATPPGVDYSLLCGAHRIPHLKVTSPEELDSTLQRAWSMRRHCVVEVVTNRASNAEHHRLLAGRAADAAARALEVCRLPTGGVDWGSPTLPPVSRACTVRDAAYRRFETMNDTQ